MFSLRVTFSGCDTAKKKQKTISSISGEKRQAERREEAKKVEVKQYLKGIGVGGCEVALFEHIFDSFPHLIPSRSILYQVAKL